MTNEEKSEIIIKWCSFLEDEAGIPEEELNVLWECHDVLCGIPIFHTEEEITNLLGISMQEYSKHMTKEGAKDFLSGIIEQ